MSELKILDEIIKEFKEKNGIPEIEPPRWIKKEEIPNLMKTINDYTWPLIESQARRLALSSCVILSKNVEEIKPIGYFEGKPIYSKDELPDEVKAHLNDLLIANA